MPNDKKEKLISKSHEEIAAEFQCDRSTSNIREVSKNANALKTTGPKFPQIEQAFGMWIGTIEQKQLFLIGEVIRQKALEFVALLEVPKKLKDVLKLYEPKDIFNTDEYGLFYRMEPDISLLTSVRKGKKKNKSRITVVCMSNADGTEKIKPLVINKSRMPLAFCHEGIIPHNQLPVDYDYNEKVWIFDNLEDYPNICVHFLPPNTTAHLQPMDAGIINAFKAHYKHLYIKQVIHDFDRGVEEPSKIDILQAIRLVKAAWEAISTETLKNCWRHTGILPQQHLVKLNNEAQEVIDLTKDTNLQQLTQDYLDDNEPIETEEVLDDERIIEFVKIQLLITISPINK
ncbi:24526_t:CDS:2 [Gigaspora rosea]|nr:24526_t:CDS:2 [Gigaspora rosea]